MSNALLCLTCGGWTYHPNTGESLGGGGDGLVEVPVLTPSLVMKKAWCRLPPDVHSI